MFCASVAILRIHIPSMSPKMSHLDLDLPSRISTPGTPTHSQTTSRRSKMPWNNENGSITSTTASHPSITVAHVVRQTVSQSRSRPAYIRRRGWYGGVTAGSQKQFQGSGSWSRKLVIGTELFSSPSCIEGELPVFYPLCCLPIRHFQGTIADFQLLFDELSLEQHGHAAAK